MPESTQGRRSGHRSRELWGHEPLDQQSPPRHPQGPLRAQRARISRMRCRGCLIIWLPRIDKAVPATAGAGRPLAARALRGTPVDRRGTPDRRLRCAAPGIARSAGHNAASCPGGRGRCAHASPQPPRPAGCADGDSSRTCRCNAAGYALYPNGERCLRSLQRLRELYPARAAGANTGDRRALHVQAR